jgi:two-component sensor histidine kinase
LKLEKNLEDVYLDVSVALPIGLIINEAVTNCIKYAFPKHQKGTVTLNPQQATDGLIELTVKDNGVGPAATEDKKSQASLGLRLMKGLAEQINGIFNISSDQGTKSP